MTVELKNQSKTEQQKWQDGLKCILQAIRFLQKIILNLQVQMIEWNVAAFFDIIAEISNHNTAMKEIILKHNNGSINSVSNKCKMNLLACWTTKLEMKSFIK